MLRVEALQRSFGGLRALDDVGLEVGEGEVVGLIGPNGSGKTTLFNVLSGVYPPDGGRIRLDGAEIGGLPAHRIARLGIARTFQNLRIYRRMTVFENVWVAQHSLPGVRWPAFLTGRGRAERARREEVERLLRATGLAARRDSLAGTLPLPEQRRLELARALARRPRLLLLDEPAGGMTPGETDGMAGLIAEVALPGRTCILIEHKMDLVSALCPRICVLNFGRKIAEGRAETVLREPAVLEAYLGRDQADA